MSNGAIVCAAVFHWLCMCAQWKPRMSHRLASLSFLLSSFLPLPLLKRSSSASKHDHIQLRRRWRQQCTTMYGNFVRRLVQRAHKLWTSKLERNKMRQLHCCLHSSFLSHFHFFFVFCVVRRQQIICIICCDILSCAQTTATKREKSLPLLPSDFVTANKNKTSSVQLEQKVHYS